MKHWISILAVLILPQFLHAAQWRATVGADSNDQGTQALAFLPNEMWIHAGDSIVWTFVTNEIHTVTFLTDGHPRLPFPVGCPGFTANPATFTGLNCVTTPPLVKPEIYTVTFTTAGNYKLVCLVHENMTATINVLASSAALPHNQDFYDKEAQREKDALLSDEGDHGDHNGAKNAVTAGNGQVVATGGGSETVSHMRFMDDKAEIRAGDTLEWTNEDPVTPHTITFGVEPLDPMPPSGNVTTDADGARHATINSTSDNVHSGFIVAGPQERLFTNQLPLPVTRFRVTFTHSGVYPYKCALHDNLGMTGTVKVKQ
jgi:plastocyanin